MRKLAIGVAAAAVLAAGLSEGAAPGSPKSSLFPVPGPVAVQKEFWVRIFARVSTSEVLIHDEENLRVYSTLRLDSPWSGSQSQRLAIRAERHKHEAVLLALAEGRTPPPEAGPMAERLRRMLAGQSRQEVWRSAYSVRAQPGLREKFRQGYIRSGRYLPRFEAIFRRRGLPLDLTLLPHVESGFEEMAYSKARAAGMWQFTQPTGRLFMRVDGAVDGRRDPFISGEAAADLLRLNYQELGTWPLALTAYNHGAHGMQRAVAALGTRDFGAIVKGYRGHHFGFASRNFYGEFLAAVHIHRNIRDYYGPLAQDPPARFDVFHLPQPMPLDDLARRIGLPRELLRPLNPALGAWVARGRGHIPRGYPLRVPEGQGGQVARAFAAGGGRPLSAQEKDGAGWAFVAPGDTLSGIALRHKVSVQDLMAANGLRDALIHPGERLLVPQMAAARPPASGGAASAKSAPAAPKPEAGKPQGAAPETREALAAPEMEEEPRLVGEDQAPPIDWLEGVTAQEEPADRLPVQTVGLQALPAGEKSQPRPEAAPKPEGQETVSPLREEALREALSVSATGKDGIGRVHIQENETISHFAEWLEVSPIRLQRLNGLRKGRAMPMGRELKVPLDRVSKADFLERRLSYHRGLKEKFEREYAVSGTVRHKLAPKENVWTLVTQTYRIPFWLVQGYNPGKNLRRLVAGEEIVVPLVKPR